jgi:hypothetical protein
VAIVRDCWCIGDAGARDVGRRSAVVGSTWRFWIPWAAANLLYAPLQRGTPSAAECKLVQRRR